MFQNLEPSHADGGLDLVSPICLILAFLRGKRKICSRTFPRLSTMVLNIFMQLHRNICDRRLLLEMIRPLEKSRTEELTNELMNFRKVPFLALLSIDLYVMKSRKSVKLENYGIHVLSGIIRCSSKTSQPWCYTAIKSCKVLKNVTPSEQPPC